MHTGKGSDTAIGLYMNTLPLRVDVDDDPVEVAVRKVHNSLAELLEHEHASLALAQRCSSIPGGQPLFSSLLNFRRQRVIRSSSNSTGIVFLDTVGSTNYPVNLSIDDDGTTLYVTAHAAQPVNSERLFAYTQKALEVLTAVETRILHTSLRSLMILPEKELELITRTWNATECRSPDPPCIHEIFERQVLRTPDAIALVHEDERISYAELNHRANQLAHQLINFGVSPEKPVGLCIGRTPAMIVGMLAILKAGGAYVPVDPAYTSERLLHILDDATPHVVLADEEGRRSLRSIDFEKFAILDPNIESDFPGTNPLVPELSSINLAYVIYTSGTTGKPKGVMIEHRNIVCFLDGNDSWSHFDADDTWWLNHSIAFDFSVWEIWGSLGKGAKLIILSQDVSLSPQDMWGIIREQEVTILTLTPSAFSMFENIDTSRNRLRYILFGADKLEQKMLRWWFSRHGDTSPRLVNAYGPTETTVYATFRLLCAQDEQTKISSIGRKLSHNTISLLDSYKQPVPVEAIGEIYLGGTSVARGYLNRCDLTQERFLSNPFSDVFDAKMYRSGDRAHYLESGELIYVGRNDDQIKIRGFRIEPSEIEACLIMHPQVTQALVCVTGEAEFSRMVAYVVGDVLDNRAAELRKYASSKLPEYMVPSAFVMLDKFPLTHNGKINRSALPTIDQANSLDQAFEEPQTAIEIELARIWGELLEVDRVGRRDSFFALGGNSLHAVIMTERMKSIGWNFNVRDLFDHPVLFELANGVVQHLVREVPPNVLSPNTRQLTPEMFPLIDLTQSDIDKIISKVPGGVSNIEDVYALSPLQDGLLFHNLLAPENDPYNLIYQMSFTDRSSLDRYLSAIQFVVDRHDILRTAFIWEGMTIPAQVVWRAAPILIEEMTGQISTLLTDVQQYRVNLDTAPLLRYLVVRADSERWVLTGLFHHLIMDHSTLELIHGEIRAFFHGEDANLPKPSPFRNFIAEVRFGVSQEAHERFFGEMLGDINEPTLPFGVSEVYRDGSNVTESSEMLTHELNKHLRGLARKFNVSLSAIFHVAYAVLISVTSGRKNVVFGTVLLGRMKTNVRYDSTLGLFINTLPIKVNVDETPIRKSLQRTHDLLARLFDHEHASLALAQRCSGVARGMPLFTALLNYRHNELPSVRPSIVPGMEYLEAIERTNYPVIMSVEDFGSQLGLTTQVVHPISSERFRSHMRQAVHSVANASTELPEISLRSIDVLTCEERTELAKTRNCTENEYPDLCCVHHYFEQQVHQTPSATALMFADQTMTYAELNSHANRLAHQLIELDVKSNEPVALCVERCPAMIIGLLAILKSGAAYVPLDPAYSSDRSSYILNDTAPRIAIVDRTGRSALGDGVLVDLIVIDPEILAETCDQNPTLSTDESTNLAYIIYTSGSTGRPKGVMIEHKNVVRLFSATDAWFDFDARDNWCLLTSIAFDVSVWELWGALLSRAKLTIVPRDVARSPRELHGLVRDQNVTILNLTPEVFGTFADICAGNSVPDTLRYIVLAGDRLRTETLHSWFAICQDTSPRLVNMYGTTETTVHATCKVLRRLDAESMTSLIGTRLLDERMYLLDDHRRPVPMGVVGEIYIGGAGVARGYLNREDLTDERFLSDPFSDAFDVRMYRTGDLARYVEDGGLAYAGRNDDQVKIRGFRVEPSEVESCLVRHPAVHRAHVRATSTESIDRLVAYVVLTDEIEDSINVLRQHVESQLPEFMVPSAFVRLAELPLTQNGKIDFRSLPALEQQHFARNTFEKPRGAIEIVVASTWGQLLGIDSVGRRDDFFALGGHSLLAVRVISLLTYRGIICTLNDLFQFPVLADFALKSSPDACLSSRGAVVSVRSSGSEPPLFCVPTGYGDFSYAFALGNDIRSSCPIYALPWPFFRDDGTQSMQELATYTIGLMKTVQPRGPYRICGYSSGGILAYCVVEMLSQAGEQISFLGLIDTCTPSIFDDTPFFSENNLFLDDLSGKWGSDSAEKIQTIRDRVDELDLIQCIELAQQLQLYPANVCPDLLAKRLRQPLFYEQVMRRYRPEKLQITVHLFRATIPSFDHTRTSGSSDVLEDDSIGWSLIVPNSLLRITPIHGDHESIVEDRENRLALCQCLCAAMDLE